VVRKGNPLTAAAAAQRRMPIVSGGWGERGGVVFGIIPGARRGGNLSTLLVHALLVFLASLFVVGIADAAHAEPNTDGAGSISGGGGGGGEFDRSPSPLFEEKSQKRLAALQANLQSHGSVLDGKRRTRVSAWSEAPRGEPVDVPKWSGRRGVVESQLVEASSTGKSAAMAKNRKQSSHDQDALAVGISPGEGMRADVESSRRRIRKFLLLKARSDGYALPAAAAIYTEGHDPSSSSGVFAAREESPRARRDSRNSTLMNTRRKLWLEKRSRYLEKRKVELEAQVAKARTTLQPLMLDASKRRAVALERVEAKAGAPSR